ncbi:MAG: mechanosensitive ion channel family protein [Myxococcales bacterium]|nr:mechanosensitive ion channel family protein [Myxococcales bacterium]USN50764.1 MAG: mechanosensitive ion channel family protein [Myxococcales bacterium]
MSHLFSQVSWATTKAFLITVCVVASFYIIGKIFSLSLLKRFINLSQSRRWRFSEAFFTSVKKVLTPFLLSLSFVISIQFWNLEGKSLELASDIVWSVFIIIISHFLILFFSQAVTAYGGIKKTALPAATLGKNIISILVIILGFLFILHQFGVSIAPFLTAVGVGGVAVALALQETLSNLVAGINITMGGEIQKGDYIKLDTGEIGSITDISWRETSLKMRENNIIRIPNSRLTKAILTIYDRPIKEFIIFFTVGVDYSSDLEHVEKVTLEIANEVQKNVKEATYNFEPRLRYQEFADSSINLIVALGCENFESQFMVRHEFVKRLHKRFKQEGISIPFPMRTLSWYQAAPKV